MNILWVTPQLPSLRSGVQVRQYYLLRDLCRRNRVTVLSLIRDIESGDLEPLRDLGIQVIPEFFEPPTLRTGWGNRLNMWGQLLFDPQPHFAYTYPLRGLQVRLSQYLASNQPDLVQFEHALTMPLAALTGRLPRILSAHNIEYMNQRRQVRSASKLSRRVWGFIEGEKLKRWERSWIRHSSGVVVVSDADAKLLENVAPPPPVFVVPNGVDTVQFAPSLDGSTQPQGLLFFGTLGYAPNVEALTFFCCEVLPLIHTQLPDIELTIVGGNAPPEIIALGRQPGVRYVGYVADVRPFLWQAALTVVPLRSGGGTRLKILESLAAGCPVVSTSIGAEGLNLQAGKEIEIQDSPEQFAASLVRLLREPLRRQVLADYGRQAVRAKYDWSCVAPRLEEAYTVALEHGV